MWIRSFEQTLSPEFPWTIAFVYQAYPPGRDGPELAWEKQGCKPILGVVFEGARSRPALHWCIALPGEPAVKLGPEARGVVIGEAQPATRLRW